MTKFLEFRVAGVTFEGRQEHVKNLAGGEDVQIRPEPENKYDPNALAVHVAAGFGTAHIGYVPRELAEKIAPLLDGEALIAKVVEINGGFEKFDGTWATYGVRVAVEIPAED